MLSLVKDIICAGVLNDNEVHVFRQWLIKLSMLSLYG